MDHLAALGTHSILELYGCPSELLNDEFQVRAFVREAALKAGCTILGEVSHTFEPQGVTAVVLLAESHISAHTWPEVGYVAVDVFTCGGKTMPEAACRYMTHMFEARSHTLRTILRGEKAPQPELERNPTPDQGGTHQFLAAADQ